MLETLLSSVSDCADGGLGTSLPRTSQRLRRRCDGAPPPPPSLPRIHFAHEVGTPFACELRSERARPPRVPLAHILSYGRTTMSIYIADWSGMDMVVPTGRRRSSLARRRFHASTVRPAMRRRTAQTETPPTMRLMLFPCASLPEVASAPTTGTGGGGDGGGGGRYRDEHTRQPE